MIIHEIGVNQIKSSFWVIFSPQNSDKIDRYLILQNLISLISPELGISIPSDYNELEYNINKHIQQSKPQTPPQGISLVVNCINSELIVDYSDKDSVIDFTFIKK